ncbi:MAG: ABC transporter ATP-binding protein [Deltaproteobacteria bacterium]|jgi:putative ABC transport system ATP-binding protein|nr:ABC transporter ATP-binding protein [Deltaproteobacteria bacterium]
MKTVSERDVLEPMPGTNIIHARELTRVYRHGSARVIGVDRIDLAIGAGEMIVLKGNSGSGKSTLLSLLAGLDRPSSGDLVVAAHDLTRISEKRLTHFRRKAIGMVFQSFNLLPTLTVFENACLPALLAGRTLAETASKAAELLGWLNLAHRSTHLPAQLSGGEMQRTAIARSLINDPAIILADEPTGNLDSRNGEAVMALLAELSRTGRATVIVATHSSLADPYATCEITLRDGRIAAQP